MKDGRTSTSFDSFAGSYEATLGRSVAFAGENAGSFVEDKVRRLCGLYGGAPPARVVDIGCGVGLLTEGLAKAWPHARLTGLDISGESLAHAAQRCRDRANIAWRAYDGACLPADVEAADLVILANVMHHVAPAARHAFLRDVVVPALRPGGQVVVFEHNPLNPVTRFVVRLCPFDRGVRLVWLGAARRLLAAAGLAAIRGDYIVFFPPRLATLSRRDGWLRRVPLGAQWMLVGLKGGGR